MKNVKFELEIGESAEEGSSVREYDAGKRKEKLEI